MPELPEVARTAINLHTALVDKDLTEIKVHSGRYSRHGNPKGMDEFVILLPAKIKSVDFHGKLIIFEFEMSDGSSWWCWNTLGMSGGWRTAATKHGHVEFVTADGSVWFTDVRNFGTLKFTNSRKETLKKIEGIGPNYLKEEISDEVFKKQLMKTPDSDICQALMNQHLIGGVGNYIKAEVLYRSRISPHRKVKNLSIQEFSTLNRECRQVIIESFGKGGSSFRNYLGLDGDAGEFPFFFRVYGRSECYMGYKVITETTSDGRTTHWVPQLQS